MVYFLSSSEEVIFVYILLGIVGLYINFLIISNAVANGVRRSVYNRLIGRIKINEMIDQGKSLEEIKEYLYDDDNTFWKKMEEKCLGLKESKNSEVS